MGVIQDVHEAIIKPVVSHRYIVTFLMGKVPSPTDYAFSRISGLSSELQVSEYRQGGDNLGNLHLPDQVRYGRLTFQDGVRLYSPLKKRFNDVMQEFNTSYMTVVIILIDASNTPLASWTLSDALPVSWQTSDLDASSSAVLINSLTLAYKELIRFGVYA